MSPHEAYCLFNNLKLHFSSIKYDFVKYNGKSYFNKHQLEDRNDRHFYSRLAKKQDVKNFLIANFIASSDPGKLWIGTVVSGGEHDKIFTDWQKRTESFSYFFREELDRIESDDFNSLLKVVDGRQYPPLLQLLMSGDVSYETVLAINSVSPILQYWNTKITDTLIWPEYELKLKKYQVFFKPDKNRCKQILQKRFTSSSN